MATRGRKMAELSHDIMEWSDYGHSVERIDNRQVMIVTG